jgi:L-threonylcarbamoyladenylate synthase
MKLISLNEGFNEALAKSEEVLNYGGLVIFPTDTVYGLACRVDFPKAIERIYSIKGRNHTKALSVLIGDFFQVRLLTGTINLTMERLVQHFWPGALTIVVDKDISISNLISMDGSIGIRLPDYDFVRELCIKSGPLVTTSANLSSHPSALSAQDAIDQIGQEIDLVVDGGISVTQTASTVIDCRLNPVNMIREGAINFMEIENYLNTFQDKH